MNRIFVAVLAFGLLFSKPSLAQQQQVDTEQLTQQIEVMFMAMLDVLSSPRMGIAMAKFYRSFYDGLIEQGFTKEEAMKIISSTPLPINRN